MNKLVQERKECAELLLATLKIFSPTTGEDKECDNDIRMFSKTNWDAIQLMENNTKPASLFELLKVTLDRIHEFIAPVSSIDEELEITLKVPTPKTQKPRLELENSTATLYVPLDPSRTILVHKSASQAQLVSAAASLLQSKIPSELLQSQVLPEKEDTEEKEKDLSFLQNSVDEAVSTNDLSSPPPLVLSSQDSSEWDSESNNESNSVSLSVSDDSEGRASEEYDDETSDNEKKTDDVTESNDTLVDQKKKKKKDPMAELRETVLEYLINHGSAKEFDDKYQLVDEIGGGSFGLVFKCKRRSDNKVFAVKISILAKIPAHWWVNDPVHGRVPREVAFLKRMRHPNIIYCEDFVLDETCSYMVTPLHGDITKDPKTNETYRPDLFDALKIHTFFSEQDTKDMFRQLASALVYLHDHNIIHRDIKDENILIDEKGKLVFVDFGSSAVVQGSGEKSFMRFWGTPDFEPPECVRGEAYTGPPQDVYALGVVLYLMLCGKVPFETKDAIVEGKLEFPAYRSKLTNACMELVARMLDNNPETRATAHQVLAHPWLKK